MRYEIKIVNPDYWVDWLMWKVYYGPYLEGAFHSRWQAEQFAKELKERIQRGSS